MITREEYSECLAMAHVLALQIEQLPLEEMLNEISRAEALGPILDPTLFARKAQSLRQDGELLGALAAVKRTITGGRARARAGAVAK